MVDEKTNESQTDISSDADVVSQGSEAPVPPPIIPRDLSSHSEPDPSEPTSFPSFLQEESGTNDEDFVEQTIPMAPPVIPVMPDSDADTVAESVVPEETEAVTQPPIIPAMSESEEAVEEQVEPSADDLSFLNQSPEWSEESVDTEKETALDMASEVPVEEQSEADSVVDEVREAPADDIWSVPDMPISDMNKTDEVAKEEQVEMPVPDKPNIPAMPEEEQSPSEPEELPDFPTGYESVEMPAGETASKNPVEDSVAQEDVSASESTEEPVENYKSEHFLEDLFANDNTCVTTPDGAFPVKDDTRALLALFSNGRFFVAENARFDGKVLGFEYLAKKRRLQVGRPEYVPTIVINDIYEYAVRNAAKKFIPQVVESDAQEQVRMQRDFVTIVTRAAMQHVSDIHIVVADHTTVMFRINGLMQTEMEYNKEWGENFVRAAFASADISDSNYAQNEYQAAQKLGRTPLRGSGGRLILPRNVLGIRLQFNPIAFGSRYVVMRMLYAEDNPDAASDLESLGFSKKETDIFYQMRAIPTGIVVISGPTGSGKSTTLQRNMIAMLQERNYEINLITVEDPPEYPIPGARQMPVTNASIEEAKEREFTKALSAALRSDPDALMIGEVRTLSAADLAFRGALSGHNVWTTLHANSAPAILMRLKDIGVEDFKLQDPSIMKGMMAQRLFRKLCPHCRQKATELLTHPSVQRLRKAFGDDALEQCYIRGPGCDECDNRGVKGRTVIGEFLLPDATFLDLMVRGEVGKATNYWINDLGGITLREASIARMLKGIVDIEEVERWTGFLDQQIMA